MDIFIAVIITDYLTTSYLFVILPHTKDFAVAGASIIGFTRPLPVNSAECLPGSYSTTYSLSRLPGADAPRRTGNMKRI
jgi:hypothetical protein